MPTYFSILNLRTYTCASSPIVFQGISHWTGAIIRSGGVHTVIGEGALICGRIDAFIHICKRNQKESCLKKKSGRRLSWSKYMQHRSSTYQCMFVGPERSAHSPPHRNNNQLRHWCGLACNHSYSSTQGTGNIYPQLKKTIYNAQIVE